MVENINNTWRSNKRVRTESRDMEQSRTKVYTCWVEDLIEQLKTAGVMRYGRLFPECYVVWCVSVE